MNCMNAPIFTNNALVLYRLVIFRNETLRQIADTIGIRERSVQTIVNNLEASGFLTRVSRAGPSRNYKIHMDKVIEDLPMKPTVSQLIDFMAGGSDE